MTDLRRYFAIAAAFLGILLLVTQAFAAKDSSVASEHRNAKSENAGTERADNKGEAATVEGAVSEGQGGEDTHGACVSAAAHLDAEGLEGLHKGMFVSSVAQQVSLVGEDCDFSAQLDAALSAQTAEGAHGEAAQARVAEHGAEGGGRESGQANRTEHKPD